MDTGALEVIPETQSEAVEEPKKMSHSSLFFNDQIIFEKSFGSNDVIKDEEYKDREQIDLGGFKMHNRRHSVGSAMCPCNVLN